MAERHGVLLMLISRVLVPSGSTPRILRWSGLKGAGQSRLLKTSYLWLVIVPLLAHVLQAAPATVHLVWPGDFDLHLALPFSWRCFYWSAACVAIADLVFYLRCPAIVKDHDDAGQFLTGGKAAEHLAIYAREVFREFRRSEGAEMEFWNVYDALNVARPVARAACAMLYGFGLVLFAVVAVQNLFFVAQLTFTGR